MKVIFDAAGKDWVLGLFNKTVDEEGFIVEKSSKIRVLSPDGQEITSSELAVIKKGSERFIAGDLTSLMKVAKGEL